MNFVADQPANFRVNKLSFVFCDCLVFLSLEKKLLLDTALNLPPDFGLYWSLFRLTDAMPALGMLDHQLGDDLETMVARTHLVAASLRLRQKEWGGRPCQVHMAATQRWLHYNTICLQGQVPLHIDGCYL